MKLIKLLVTMSLINAILVMGIAQFSPKNPKPVLQESIPSSTSAQNGLDTQSQFAVSPLPSASATVPVVPISKPTVAPVATKTPVATVKPTTAPTATPSPTVAPTAKPTGCVIQIDGVSYEITSLRQTHSGGDVFTCGTDMSAIFWRKHNSRILQIMQQYKI